MSRAAARLVLLLVVAPSVAVAAGLEVPENGALMIGRGGTAVSLPGSAYALQFNPAGLTEVDGFDVRVDGRLVSHDVTFTRARRVDEGKGIDDTFDTVRNTAGPFVAPALAVAYRNKAWLDGRLGFGVGVWGPPGVGRYAYPDPKALWDGGNGAIETGLASGQRYTVVSSSTSVLFPSLGAGFRVSDGLSVGLTLQSGLAIIRMRQAIAAASSGGRESVTADGLASLDVVDAFVPALVAGVLWEPMPGFRVGASFRPPVDVVADGTLKIETLLGSGIDVTGDRATLRLTLPPVLRAGATLVAGPFTWSAELAFEGWSANRELVLTPHDVRVTVDGTTTTLPEFRIAKQWVDAGGLRLGGTWNAIAAVDGGFGLDVHAGLLGETNAVPETRQAPDTVTGTRLGGGAGISLKYGGFALTLSALGYVPVTLEVTKSEVSRGVAGEPDAPPVLVGNGTYTSSVWMLGAGLAWTGGGSK